MKKFGIVFVLSAIFFSAYSFAQIDTSGTVLMDKLDMAKVHNNQINNVMMRFCNYGFQESQLSSSLDFIMRPHQKKQVCVVLINKSNVPLTIVPSVVPGSQNENGNILCSNSGELTGGIVLVDPSSLSGNIVLQPHEQLVKYFSISSAETASGKYYACFAVNLETKEKLSADSLFNLVVRKAGNMKIAIVGDPYQYQWFDDIVAWFGGYTRLIAKVGIVICSLLLLYSLVPFFRPKKKRTIKK